MVRLVSLEQQYDEVGRKEESGMAKMIRVLVVDDSTFMRESLSAMLAKDPRIVIAGMARNG